MNCSGQTNYGNNKHARRVELCTPLQYSYKDFQNAFIVMLHNFFIGCGLVSQLQISSCKADKRLRFDSLWRRSFIFLVCVCVCVYIYMYICVYISPTFQNALNEDFKLT
jgi:hypothetical protein